MSNTPLNATVSAVTAACFLALAVTEPIVALAQAPAPPAAGAPAASASTDTGAPAFKQEELDAMLAPIALYPDALLAQTLMASTYPLQIVEAARWAEQNKGLKGDALSNALQGQKWDESVKSLTAFPEVLDRMNKDLAWTQKLGDAFLAQQKQVMDTIQSLRKRAADSGNLKTNEQQKVTIENNYYTIEPANPEIVYVPTYQPTVVYGGWPYPAYPPYYPPYWAPIATPFVAGFAWGVGIAAGAALWGGCNWGRGDVNVNVNRYNNFNKTNISNGNWQHNAANRQGVPYRDNASRQKYGGAQDRQASQARDQFRGRQDSLGGQGLQDRAGLQQARDSGVGQRGGAADRAGASNFDRGGAGGAGGGNRDFNRGGGGGNLGASASPTNRGGGFNSSAGGAQTRDFSSRGNSSMGSRSGGGGGGARAGGGGGGGRGGGGGGRGGGGRR